MMCGLKIKEVIIHYENVTMIREAIIALSNTKISDADALIGINLLEGGFENGHVAYNQTKSKKIIC